MKRSKSLSHLGRRHIPLPTGRFVVGCWDIMTSYTKFGVFVRLYYPAKEKNATDRYMQWPKWIPSKEYVKGFARRQGISPALFKAMKLILIGDVFIPALWQADLCDDMHQYPVIIFSHGLGAWRTAYSTICVEMASQGFVVAALEHRDNSACATFYKKQARMSFCGESPGSYLNDMEEAFSEHSDEWKDLLDGHWTPRAKFQSIGPPSENKEWIYYKSVKGEVENVVRLKQLRTRAQECVKVLDLLENFNDGKPVVNILDQSFPHRMLRGRLDMSKVAIAGHSFGGATTILALATDRRFRVGIALDPWMFPFQSDQSALSRGHQPLLAINMERFQDSGSLQIMSALQRNEVERKFFTVRKAYHRDQCDINFTRRRLLQLLDKTRKSVEKFTVIDLTSRLMLEFLGKHLEVPVSEDFPDIWSRRKKYLREETFV